MKKSLAYASVLLVILPSLLIAADPIRSADSLVNLHKYCSAFELLNRIDSANENRQVVFKKMDIALNYFVESLNHMIFSFKDIGQNEDIMSFRGKEGTSEMFVFPIDSILLRLLTKYPHDGNIYKRLGDYYQDVLSRYGGRWIVSDDSLAITIMSYYGQAEKHKSMDFKSYDRLGAAYFRTGKYSDAERCFRASMKLNPGSPNSPYNLAYLLYKKKQFKAAIPFAQKSFDLYNTLSLKSDAGRLCATCFSETGDYDNALKYLRLTDEFDPNNYYVYRNIMWTFLKMRSTDSAIASSVRFFNLKPTNPRLAQDILADYQEAGQSKDIPKVLRTLMDIYSNNAEAYGNILFHFSNYYQDESNYPLSLAFLDSAEAQFRTCLPDTHYVFKVIAIRRSNLQNK
jgi:tetratricopeptide (TPR) repeat protein